MPELLRAGPVRGRFTRLDGERHARVGRQAAALQGVIAALAEPLAQDEIARRVLQRSRRAIGGGPAMVALLTEHGRCLEVTATAGWPGRGRPRELPLDADLPFGQALRTGRPVWMPTVDDGISRYPSLLSSGFPAWSLGSAILPLDGDRGPSGVLVLSGLDRKMFAAGEKGFVVALARLCGQALTGASLRDRERGTRRRAEESSRRLTFLARAGKLLNESLDVQRTLDHFAALCVETAADWCAIVLTAEYGSATGFAAHKLESLNGGGARHVGIPHPVLAALTGESGALRSVSGAGVSSAMTFAVAARGHRLGTATLATADSRHPIAPEDVRLIEELVARAAVAIDNSGRYQRQYRAARDLQRNLLPRRLPSVPGVQLAGRYLQGSRGLDVGGDWYDAFPLPDGKLGLAIGDVAGRGVRAARVMGELRSVLRTYALDGYAPAQVASRVNRLAQTFEEHEISTLVYLVFDPHQRTARFVRAGHPPPVVLHGGRRPQVLDERGSLPLGVLGDARFVEGRVALEPGSTILLYTDGLIERRDRNLDAGIAALGDAMATGPDGVEELCDHVLERMGAPADQPDDVALIALRGPGR